MVRIVPQRYEDLRAIFAKYPIVYENILFTLAKLGLDSDFAKRDFGNEFLSFLVLRIHFFKTKVVNRYVEI